MASILKRVSPPTEAAVSRIAEAEGRTFVMQLDKVVEAGLDALGYTPAGEPKQAKSTRKATAKSTK